jgi:hypothetical protein
LAPDGPAPPAITLVRTAVSPRLLIRMRSQVQVLAGPPAIIAGQSAAGSKPGALAASLGRAGAARPSLPASPSAPPGPPTRAAGLTTTTHRGRHPGPDGSHAAGAATSRRSLILCLAPPPRALRRPAWHGRSAGTRRRRTQPGPGSATDAPADQHASRQHRSRPGLLGRRPNRSTARQPTGTRPVPVVTGARRTDLGPTPPPGMGADGHIRTDGADDSRRPDRRTPGRQTQVTGHRTGWIPDGWTAGSRTTTPVDTRCWTPIGDRCHGWRPGSVDQGDDA